MGGRQLLPPPSPRDAITHTHTLLSLLWCVFYLFSFSRVKSSGDGGSSTTLFFLLYDDDVFFFCTVHYRSEVESECAQHCPTDVVENCNLPMGEKSIRAAALFVGSVKGKER